MKQLTLIIGFFLTNALLGQASGNVNYQNQVRYPDNNININFPSNADLFVSVKGMANIKADSYVAIFNVTQVGKTTEEVNSLIDTRIRQALDAIKTTGVESFVDMISFVPVYEYAVEKKLFSKKSYNEIPAGFEIKKNIHIKYSDPDILNDLITKLSSAEIYDLIRVDYFSNKLEDIKKELATKAKDILQEKLKNYESILAIELDSVEKQLIDIYKVVLPVEMYKSYQAYNGSSLNLGKSADVNREVKSTTLYYQPIIDKEFDFVINPIILEPVIQVMYEIKFKVNIEKGNGQNSIKEYILVSPNGEFKALNLNE